MKLILVGGTGLIGGAVLRRAIQDPAFTSIVALTRRALPEDASNDEKVKTVIMKDFSMYSDDVMNELEGAEVCIWAMGGRLNQFPDLNTARLANVDYLRAGAKLFAEKLAPALQSKRKFRFVYCSGSFTARDASKKLYFLETSRKLKGEAENGLLELEKAHSDQFEVFIARPAGVLETDNGLQNIVYGPFGLGKGYLSYAMADIAINGATSQVTESTELREKGRELSKRVRAS